MQRRKFKKKYPLALKSRISPYSNSRIFSFKRTFTDSFKVNMDGSTTTSTDAWAFKLSDIPGYAELTSLFDKYRIRGVKATFMPRVNVFRLSDLGTGTTTATTSPPIFSVVDYDDASAPANAAVLHEYENCKCHYEFKPWSVFFRPQIAIAAYSGAFTSYATANNDMWIDAASPGVEYYGLKVATADYTVTNNLTNDIYWDVIFKVYIQCKYPR